MSKIKGSLSWDDTDSINTSTWMSDIKSSPFWDDTDSIDTSTRMSEVKSSPFWDDSDSIDRSTRMSGSKSFSFSDTYMIDSKNPSTKMSEIHNFSLSNKTDVITPSTRMREKKASLFSKKTDLINTSVRRPSPLDRFKHHFDRLTVVSLLNLRYVDAKEKDEVLRKIFGLPGVSCVTVDEHKNIIVTGTVDPITVRKELKKHRPVLVISRPTRSDESDEGGSEQLDESGSKQLDDGNEQLDEGGSKQLDEGGSEKLDESGSKQLDESGSEKLDEGGSKQLDDGSKQLDEGGSKQLDGGNEKLDEGGSEKLDEGGSKQLNEGGSKQLDGGSKQLDEGGSKQLDEGGSEKLDEGGSEKLDGELSMEDADSDEKRSQLLNQEGSQDSDSGNDITIEACKSTTTVVNNDWDSFREFLSNRLHPLIISRCSAKDVIDFLRMRLTSGIEATEAVVGYLGAKFEAHGIGPKENPFRSLAVTTYLKSAKEMMGETESILVFSCNDNLDVDETSFIETISKELHKREVTPVSYNLLGRENLDEEMLYRSSVGIMILSNSYACSRQSLDHLVDIMEHGKATNLVIIPVYFKVTLSDICGLGGMFEEVFLQYLNSAQPDRVQKCKAAIASIATFDGHEWTKETQFMLADEVVRNACLRLYLKNSKNLVRILALLNQSQPSDADIVGIWGMAGIGKTSIAREIFGILAPQYDLCYFLQDVHLTCQMKGPRQMRDDFFSKLFGEEKLSICASDVKPSFMRDWFHKKTILVVLDDVSNARDAEAVVGGFGWFSNGHRIILFSRRKQVLVQCKVKEPYEIQKLCEFESFRLCKQYLTGESWLISKLMSCSSGIPLALKVLGSSVSKQHINNMKFHLQSLRRNPPTQIQESFRRSFDGLDENEKNIFLDIACFFRGENKDHVVQLLDACGFLTYLGISDLTDESLISIVDNKIEMPIPFQDMGRFIVLEEDEDPCERSRLWDSDDIADVLTNNSGTEAIEGISLDSSDFTCELSPTVFVKMYRLRLLKLYCSTSGNECKLNLPQGLDTLPDELRLLHWENYPLEYLPQKFNPENLVEVNMPYSNMEKLWDGKKSLEKLRKINLSHSRKLTDILMLSEALNLEHIDLEGCTSLVDISTSILRHGKLVSLNMKDCSHLRSLPAMVGLTSLKVVNLSGCSEIEEILDFAPNLKELYLAGTAIRELPLSINNLTELVILDLENCRRLQQLPLGIGNLLRLRISPR